MCERFHPENVFEKLRVIEFPCSFVGLSTTLQVDVQVNLVVSAYLKTMCDGNLLMLDDARELSAPHRAYKISHIDDHTIEITFTPSNECISRAKRRRQLDNRFIFDLRLIQVDGVRCCNKEFHSEIGRLYVSGIYEYCQISNNPQIVNFGDVLMNQKVTRYVRIRNDSNTMAAKFQFIKVCGFDVVPAMFTILPDSSRRICFSIKPTCFKLPKCFTFIIINPHDSFTETTIDDGNFLTHEVSIISNILSVKKPKIVVVESLHKIIEPEVKYTYLGDELNTHLKKKAKGEYFLQEAKACRKIIPIKEVFCTGTVRCYSEVLIKPPQPVSNKYNICKRPPEKVNTFDLFNVFILPFDINFGKIALRTCGQVYILIKNNTKYGITVKLLNDNYVLYTDEKVSSITLKLKEFSELRVAVYCRSYIEGNYSGTFDYTIDNKFKRKHPYKLQVSIPTLHLPEKCLKFGMVTNESFITSVPVRVFNHFNIPVSFRWDNIHTDTPFEIIPSSGLIPSHSCKICDVIYVCKPTKSKTHEVDFISNVDEVIPIELNIITRKLSIKFQQPAVLLKDIPLNIQTVERVRLENSSREIAVFYVMEPLIPGLRIEPMSGIIRPKMVITFEIIVKISCVLDFSFDIYIKINNKENVILPISGNVQEPRIVIHPKNIYMNRIPCHMITYVPVTFQNLSALRSEVEVLNGDDNIFKVYVAVGNEKERIYEFDIEGGQSKTVFIKVCDIFRREYEMYIPFKVNGLLGPPDHRSSSTELNHYIGEHKQCYENNPRVKLKALNRDISFCRIVGVITVPWIKFSVENFEINYEPNGENAMNFTMLNISKYDLHVTIVTAKLVPHFILEILTEFQESVIKENLIKFELLHEAKVEFKLSFHPRGHGKFVAIAALFLDKYVTIPYYNLTFKGFRQTPVMTPSIYRIIFPPCKVGTSMSHIFSITYEDIATLDEFQCVSKDEKLSVRFIDIKEIVEPYKAFTTVTVEVIACSKEAYSRDNITVGIDHVSGSGCEVEISFCFTHCALTLHSNAFVELDDNPFPYFPLPSQTVLYEYMERCSSFLEKWMFQQGFRRDLFPVIPDTFLAISTAIVGTKTKGINVSYLNFVRRIAGPLMKHVRKISAVGVEEPFKTVKEIHDSYKEVINLLRSRGGNLWVLRAKFLLSYDQFVMYCENVTTKCNADIILNQELRDDKVLFNRLNKQSWFDFILQSYKVFVMDSCFFDCVCLTSQPRDIIQILIDWYNEQVQLQHNNLRGKNKPVKAITNITTDLSDGIAVISAILNYCPFMKEYFAIFCEVSEGDRESAIINNACLIIEALNQLKFYFPLQSTDFLQPNFLQMLFLAIHLYVALPMFVPKNHIEFNPPLLRSSSRQVGICPTTQESLLFNFIILNNNKNSFAVERATTMDNSKKIYINIKYVANFVAEESAILLVHGYNKTRIFDTYIIFVLHGQISSLNPLRKCKVIAPLYRPNKVDILVYSPFLLPGSFKVHITDIEPTIPVHFTEEDTNPKFYLQRLYLIDKDITLNPMPKETGQEIPEHKLYLQMICLSTQVGTSWIWFRADIGEFFIRVMSQPRWDLAIDTLQAKVHSWPMDPCSCGEACECYRSMVLMIPHRNELMVKAMRYALLEYASDTMIHVFDQLIETTTGMLILNMLLKEGGTNMSDVKHILRESLSYRIASRALIPRIDRARLSHHTSAMLALPITVPPNDKAEKYTITFSSECGMDVRTYRIFFIASNTTSETSN